MLVRDGVLGASSGSRAQSSTVPSDSLITYAHIQTLLDVCICTPLEVMCRSCHIHRHHHQHDLSSLIPSRHRRARQCCVWCQVRPVIRVTNTRALVVPHYRGLPVLPLGPRSPLPLLPGSQFCCLHSSVRVIIVADSTVPCRGAVYSQLSLPRIRAIIAWSGLETPQLAAAGDELDKLWFYLAFAYAPSLPSPSPSPSPSALHCCAFTCVD
jgi:hypothetical protein